MNLTERLHLYLQLTRLHRPIGILLLLWPTLWGVWIAGNGHPPLLIVFIFTLGTVLMRSSGCAVNDYADRHIDKHVERTKDRPLTSGKVSERETLWLAVVLALISFALILPLNPLTWLMSFPAAFLAASYPFTKRFFAIPQAYLGIAFGFGIPMAFAAQLGEVPAVAWVLLLANIFWSIAYDTEYAMVDRADDLKIGIRTSAITFGRFDVAAVMASYALFLLMWLGAGLYLGLGWPFALGVLAAAGLALWHFSLIRHRDPQGCFTAFRLNHWVGFAVFAGTVGAYALR